MLELTPGSRGSKGTGIRHQFGEASWSRKRVFRLSWRMCSYSLRLWWHQLPQGLRAACALLHWSLCSAPPHWPRSNRSSKQGIVRELIGFCVRHNRRENDKSRRWNSQADLSSPLSYLVLLLTTICPCPTLFTLLLTDSQLSLSTSPANPSPLSNNTTQILLHPYYHTDIIFQLLLPFLALQTQHTHLSAGDSFKSSLSLLLLNWICLKDLWKDKAEFVTEKPWAFPSVKEAEGRIRFEIQLLVIHIWNKFHWEVLSGVWNKTRRSQLIAQSQKNKAWCVKSPC